MANTKLIRKMFLLTDEENEAIVGLAKKEGLSVSSLTRKMFGLEPLPTGRKRKIKPGKTKS